MSLSRAFIWLGVALIGAYVAFGLVLYAFQDRAVYFVDASPVKVKASWPIEEVEVETPDAETLVAWYMAAQPGCPTMLMFHGNAGHIGKAAWQYGRINRAGVGMLAVSWRGYAGSTGKPSQAGLYMDAQASYEQLRQLGVEPNQLVIHGFSLGASPAVRVAAENDARALILEAPFYSATRMAREQLPIYPMGMLLRHKYPTDKYIGAVDEPILVAHGSADSVIPARHSEDLAKLATVPVQRKVFDGSDHNTLVRDGLYEDAVWPFLSEFYPDCPFTVSTEVTPL